MASARPVAAPRANTDRSFPRDTGSLDVDWLLHSRKDPVQSTTDKGPQKLEVEDQSQAKNNQNETTLTQSPTDASQTTNLPNEPNPQNPNTKSTTTSNGSHETTLPSTPKGPTSPANSRSSQQSPPSSSRPALPRGQSNEDNRSPGKGPVGNLKKEGGRRGSWISSLSSKFSSSNSPTPSRTSSVDSQSQVAKNSPQPSPNVEFSNPFNMQQNTKESKKETKKEDSKPVVVTHSSPRRPSVLVAAGKETKLEQPGFLSSALRRLSSSNNATLGKAAGTTGAICPRKVMNIDPNRERIKIKEFDQNKLKRVAFCVDVEIAGYAAQADEEPQAGIRPPVSAGQKQGLSAPISNATKDAKYKEKGEGAALKNPEAAHIEQEEPKNEIRETTEQSKPTISTETATPPNEQPVPNPDSQPNADGQQKPTTRKKEKKKRSEAERKERRERKRRHAEQNGLVPLEITREEDDDDDSDSSPSNTPPGVSTPKRNSDQPTTDPLRIYKRCCQLRETDALSRVKEQISKPAAALAEAPGTVGVLDLSGIQMELPDVVTLGDWLAVVPVRKLMLDNCGLTDEGIRVILSGLSGCKTSEQAKHNRKLPKRSSGKQGQEQMGVIEKLSIKHNPGITSLGWKHIALFLHMSKSIKAMDFSGIAFPTGDGESSRTPSKPPAANSNFSDVNGHVGRPTDLGALIIRAVSERLGDRLEELVLSGCRLSTTQVSSLIDCAIKCKIRRLGLADNAINQDGLNHVVRYLKSGACEGLDLGSNNLHGAIQSIAEAVDQENPLFAISFSNCNLDPNDLETVLRPFSKLKSLKFIDLSRNHDLFVGEKTAVPIFRRLLPKLSSLKRIHLSDVGMTPEQIIGLAEVLPDCPSMAHLSVLDNQPLIDTMNSKENSAQEEACAFFASLMTAVRVSDTIVAIEIEIPSSESSEVVKALASQVVAYSLRNMERSALSEVGDQPTTMPNKDTPEVLLHLVGHMDGYAENHDNDDPAPDQDYMIASTGIVKALSVCLGTKDGNSRSHSRNISPSVSGTATPRQGQTNVGGPKKPRNVSMELCESARKIRTRLRMALIKEDKAGNDDDYRRLFYLDQTLQRMIQRFEDEYPESKLPDIPSSPPNPNGMPPLESTRSNESTFSTSVTSLNSGKDIVGGEAGNLDDPHGRKLSQASLNTSLAAKAFTEEEGRMHRFGQSIRRELLRPTGTDDYAHGTSLNDDPEPAHLAAFRSRLEEFKGEEIRARVEKDGADDVVRELGMNAQELMMLQKDDPASFEAFKNSQLAAQFNAGIGSDGQGQFKGD